MSNKNDFLIKNISSSGFDLHPELIPDLNSNYNINVSTVMSDGTKLEDTLNINFPTVTSSIRLTGNFIENYDNLYLHLTSKITLISVIIDNKEINHIELDQYSYYPSGSYRGAKILSSELNFNITGENSFSIILDDSFFENKKTIVSSVKLSVYTKNYEKIIKIFRIIADPIKNISISGKSRIIESKIVHYNINKIGYNNILRLASLLGILPTSNLPTITTNRSDKITISNITLDGFDATYDVADGDEFTATITATFTEDLISTFNVDIEYINAANTRSVGDILCSDGTYITPTINWENGECTSIELNGKTPIGIVVVPGSHDDGSARIMSLLECDLTNPSTPTTTHNYMYWGGYGTDTSLTNYNTVPLLNGTTANIGYTGTKWSVNSMTTLNSTTGLYYKSSGDKLKSPYLSDGVSQDTSSLVGAMSDFDGKGNTDTLISLATKDSNWRTGSITNSYSSGYYPAVCCCYRYNTPGTQEGDWYLPASEELVYVVYYLKLFNSILSQLNTLNSGSAVEMGTSGYWSSSEYNSGRSYFMGMDYGNVGYNAKNNSYYVRPFMKI